MRYFLNLFFIIGSLLSLVACQRPVDQKPAYGDTMIIGHFYPSPPNLNPLFSLSGVSAVFLQRLLFNGLVEIDQNMQAQPSLAKDWQRSADGLEWGFYLRKGLRFHDGHELTASDVQATYDLLRKYPDKTSFPELFRLIRSISLPGKYTIKIELSSFSADFIHCLSYGILPKRVADRSDPFGPLPDTQIIGTGPFKLARQQGKEIVLEANPHYFKGRPYLERVIIRQYPDQQHVWARLMRGEIDFFYDISPNNYAILEGVPALRVYSYLHPYYYLLALNRQKPLFQDPRVGQALNYALDRERLITQVLQGRGQPAIGPIYPLSWAYDPQIKAFPYNPTKALNILKEAGWEDHDGDRFLDKGGRPLEFSLYIVQGDRMMEQTGLLLQEQLLNLGIKAKIQSIPYDIFAEKYYFAKNFEACLTYLATREDPNFNYKFYHSSQIAGGMNFFSYRNPEVDRLLDQARQEPDQAKRKQLYSRFQQILQQDPPGIFLFWREMLTAVHRRFRGIGIGPGGPLLNIHELYVPRAEQKYRKE